MYYVFFSFMILCIRSMVLITVISAKLILNIVTRTLRLITSKNKGIKIEQY